MYLFSKELLQSEKVIQVLRAHQQKVKQDKIREIQERKIKKEQEPKEAVAQGNACSLLIRRGSVGLSLSWLHKEYNLS